MAPLRRCVPLHFGHVIARDGIMLWKVLSLVSAYCVIGHCSSCRAVLTGHASL